MRVIGILLTVLLIILLLPFRLLDYIFIGYWRDRKVKAWRKNPKVGDKCYFINLLGTKTEVSITRLDRKGTKNRGARIESHSSSQWMELNSLYPVKDSTQ